MDNARSNKIKRQRIIWIRYLKTIMRADYVDLFTKTAIERKEMITPRKHEISISVISTKRKQRHALEKLKINFKIQLRETLQQV